MSLGLFLYKGLSNCREAAAQGSVIGGIRVYQGSYEYEPSTRNPKPEGFFIAGLGFARIRGLGVGLSGSDFGL